MQLFTETMVETKERVKILIAKVNLSHKSAKTITITLARFISKSFVWQPSNLLEGVYN